MLTAKLFDNGRSQAVRLPKQYRFQQDEVLANKVGNVVMLYDRWINEEAIPYSIKQLFEDMYSQYEKLGPNGVMDQMHEDFKNRPTDTKTMK